MLSLSLFAASAPGGCPMAGGAPHATDLARATQTAPRAAYTADSASAIRKQLNVHLTHDPLALPNRRACEEFELHELHDALRTLHCHQETELTSSYADGDGRGGARTQDQLEASLSTEAAHVAAHPHAAVVEAARDARCHERALLRLDPTTSG